MEKAKLNPTREEYEKRLRWSKGLTISTDKQKAAHPERNVQVREFNHV